MLIDGVDVTATPTHRRQVGMVFQDNQLFPHRSVLDNVAFGLQMAGVAKHERHATRRGVARTRRSRPGFGRRDVAALSGGEAKRVALARTLIVRAARGAPRRAVDRPRSRTARPSCDSTSPTLLRATGTTALLVTHDVSEAEAIADRTVTLPAVENGADVALSATITTNFGCRRGGGDGSGGRGRRATATYDLRRRVLRDDSPTAVLEFDGDDEPTTFHLAIERDDAIVAVSTWVRRPFPDDPRDTDIQLRGMASEPALQGHGLGAALLRAGLDRAAEQGATRVWARARRTALAFYAANGFDEVGDEFVDATTGLPHRIVAIDVPPLAAHRPR